MGYNEQYKQMVEHILKNGKHQTCRNGEQLIVPHYSFTINWKDWRLNLRKMNYKGVYGEFLTFIDPKPLTKEKQFQDNGCPYWKMFADEDGNIRLDYHDELHKQLNWVVQQIISNPTDRGHVIDLWSPENVQSGVLSLRCCHYSYIFSVIGNEIHLVWNQRSGDTMLGIPSDVYLGHLLLKYIAEKTDKIPATMTFNFANAHIYLSHVENAKLLLMRDETDYNKPLKFQLF
jgi:thymidylate synthase